jgi:hypothetical protein
LVEDYHDERREQANAAEQRDHVSISAIDAAEARGSPSYA